MDFRYRGKRRLRCETGWSDERELLFLAIVLIVGLTFLTPIAELLLEIPVLVTVVVIGLIYGIIAVLLRRLVSSFVVGLIVTSTYFANIPLASTTYLESLPGGIGPQLWLFQIPLVLLLGFALLNYREFLIGVNRSEVFFAGFICWTILSALFGATKQVDTALYFSLFMGEGMVTFALLRYVVQIQKVSFRTIAQVFVGTVLAHSIVGVAQFLHGGNFGLTRLGEAGPAAPAIAKISLEPIGTFHTGAYIAGFTEMSFNLGSLIILAVPIAITLAVAKSGRSRIGLIISVLVMIGVLRVGGGDAARGGLILSLLFLFCGLVIIYQKDIYNHLRPSVNFSRRIPSIKTILVNLVATIGAMCFLLYPSSNSGSTTTYPTGDGGISTPTGDGGTSTPTGDGGTSTPTGNGGGLTFEEIQKLLDSLSIPYFDLSNLGIRLQQYIAGIDLFFQYPLFGIGGANFMYYSQEYGLPRGMPLHNIYIALLAETGLPGFVLYMLILVSVIWCGWKTMNHRTNNQLLILGMICGIVAYLAFGFWDHLQLDRPTSFIPFWVLSGAIIGMYTDS